MINYFSEFDIPVAADSGMACDLLYQEKCRLENKLQEGADPAAEERLRLIEEAFSLFSDPFRFSVYQSSLNPVQSKTASSFLPDLVSEMNFWRTKDMAVSKRRLMNLYGRNSAGKPKVLNREQTAWLYQAYSSISEQNGEQWADYAQKNGNLHISGIRRRKPVKPVPAPRQNRNAGRFSVPLIVFCLFVLFFPHQIIFGMIRSLSGKLFSSGSDIHVLTEMTPSEAALQCASGVTADNTLGDSFASAVVISALPYTEDAQSVTYDLDQKYHRFTANISPLTGSDGETVFRITGNGGNEVLYEESFSEMTNIHTIDLDISGVDALTISMEAPADPEDTCGIVISSPYLYTDNSGENRSAAELPARDFPDSLPLADAQQVSSRNYESQAKMSDSFGQIVEGISLNAGQYTHQDAYVTVYLDSRYRSFDAEIMNWSGSESYTFRICANGDPSDVRYESFRSADAVPETVHISIENADFLTIQLSADEGQSWSCALLGNASFSDPVR